MDRADPCRRPLRRLITEYSAASANLLAIEEWFLALDRIDDIQNADTLGRFGKEISAPHPFRGPHDSGLLELREYLGHEAWRNPLEVSQVTAAHRRLGRTNEPEQAVQSIFHAHRQMRHYTDCISPSYSKQGITRIMFIHVMEAYTSHSALP